VKIVVAMSGGVDSSVAALELKKKGHEIIGITMRTWPKEECGAAGEKLCCSQDAVQHARAVAEDLDIPFYVMNFSKAFNEEVSKYFVNEYSKGRTPNPCIYCNSELKFGHLYKKALSMGAKKIATGHYATIIQKNGEYYLAEAKDKKKDQSYFLYNISKATLPDIEFPLGDHTKEEVRAIASENGFMNAGRAESQDICFATSRGDYREPLSKMAGSSSDIFKPGDILNVDGSFVGRHDGIASYTVGQRRGVGLAMKEPVYVIKIDAINNTIMIGGKEHSMKRKILVGGLNWLVNDVPEKPVEFDVKIRYGSKKTRAIIIPAGNGEVMVEFGEPQFAPTPGQAAVFYDGELVSGGGWIEKVF